MNKIKSYLASNRMFFSFAWKNHKSYYLFYAITTLYSVFSNIFTVYLPKLSLTAFLEKKDFRLGVIYIVAYISIIIIWSYVERKISLAQGLNTQAITFEMKSKIYEKIGSNNMLAFEGNEQFNAFSRAFDYTERGADEFVNSLFRLLSCVLTIIGVSYVIGSVNIWIVFIVFATLIIAQLCMKKTNKLWFDYQHNERLKKIRLIQHISQLFQNKDFISEIKLFNAIPFSVNILRSKSKDFAIENNEQDIRRFKWNFFAIALNNIQFLCVHIYFGFLLFMESITIATYSTLLAAIEQFSSSFGNLLQIFTELQNSATEAEYYLSYLSDTTYEQKGKIRVDSMKNIEFENVSFAYPNQSRNAVDDVSIEISAGEKIAIVGENGSGKTTFLKILLGLYPASQGRVIFNQSYDIKDIELSSWYDKVATIMQNSIQMPLSVKDNISLADDGVDEEMLNYAIDFAGLKDYIDSLPSKENSLISKRFYTDGVDFSGGEKQKLSIARALYKSADVLVFDEPSSALDPNSEYDFFQKVYALGAGKTVIYVSHRLSTVVNADKIAVFQNGKIVELGNHSELMSQNGLYAEMFRKQASNFTVSEGK